MYVCVQGLRLWGHSVEGFETHEYAPVFHFTVEDVQKCHSCIQHFTNCLLELCRERGNRWLLNEHFLFSHVLAFIKTAYQLLSQDQDTGDDRRNSGVIGHKLIGILCRFLLLGNLLMGLPASMLCTSLGLKSGFLFLSEAEERIVGMGTADRYRERMLMSPGSNNEGDVSNDTLPTLDTKSRLISALSHVDPDNLHDRLCWFHRDPNTLIKVIVKTDFLSLQTRVLKALVDFYLDSCSCRYMENHQDQVSFNKGCFQALFCTAALSLNTLDLVAKLSIHQDGQSINFERQTLSQITEVFGADVLYTCCRDFQGCLRKLTDSVDFHELHHLIPALSMLLSSIKYCGGVASILFRKNPSYNTVIVECSVMTWKELFVSSLLKKRFDSVDIWTLSQSPRSAAKALVILDHTLFDANGETVGAAELNTVVLQIASATISEPFICCNSSFNPSQGMKLLKEAIGSAVSNIVENFSLLDSIDVTLENHEVHLVCYLHSLRSLFSFSILSPLFCVENMLWESLFDPIARLLGDNRLEGICSGCLIEYMEEQQLAQTVMSGVIYSCFYAQTTESIKGIEHFLRHAFVNVDMESLSPCSKVFGDLCVNGLTSVNLHKSRSPLVCNTLLRILLSFCAHTESADMISPAITCALNALESIDCEESWWQELLLASLYLMSPKVFQAQCSLRGTELVVRCIERHSESDYANCTPLPFLSLMDVTGAQLKWNTVPKRVQEKMKKRNQSSKRSFFTKLCSIPVFVDLGYFDTESWSKTKTCKETFTHEELHHTLQQIIDPEHSRDAIFGRHRSHIQLTTRNYDEIKSAKGHHAYTSLCKVILLINGFCRLLESVSTKIPDSVLKKWVDFELESLSLGGGKLIPELGKGVIIPLSSHMSATTQIDNVMSATEAWMFYVETPKRHGLFQIAIESFFDAGSLISLLKTMKFPGYILDIDSILRTSAEHGQISLEKMLVLLVNGQDKGFLCDVAVSKICMLNDLVWIYVRDRKETYDQYTSVFFEFERFCVSILPFIANDKEITKVWGASICEQLCRFLNGIAAAVRQSPNTDERKSLRDFLCKTGNALSCAMDMYSAFSMEVPPRNRDKFISSLNLALHEVGRVGIRSEGSNVLVSSAAQCVDMNKAMLFAFEELHVQHYKLEKVGILDTLMTIACCLGSASETETLSHKILASFLTELKHKMFHDGNNVFSFYNAFQLLHRSRRTVHSLLDIFLNSICRERGYASLEKDVYVVSNIVDEMLTSIFENTSCRPAYSDHLYLWERRSRLLRMEFLDQELARIDPTAFRDRKDDGLSPNSICHLSGPTAPPCMFCFNTEESRDPDVRNCERVELKFAFRIPKSFRHFDTRTAVKSIPFVSCSQGTWLFYIGICFKENADKTGNDVTLAYFLRNENSISNTSSGVLHRGLTVEGWHQFHLTVNQENVPSERTRPNGSIPFVVYCLLDGKKCLTRNSYRLRKDMSHKLHISLGQTKCIGINAKQVDLLLLKSVQFGDVELAYYCGNKYKALASGIADEEAIQRMGHASAQHSEVSMEDHGLLNTEALVARLLGLQTSGRGKNLETKTTEEIAATLMWKHGRDEPVFNHQRILSLDNAQFLFTLKDRTFHSFEVMAYLDLLNEEAILNKKKILEFCVWDNICEMLDERTGCRQCFIQIFKKICGIVTEHGPISKQLFSVLLDKEWERQKPSISLYRHLVELGMFHRSVFFFSDAETRSLIISNFLRLCRQQYGGAVLNKLTSTFIIKLYRSVEVRATDLNDLRARLEYMWDFSFALSICAQSRQSSDPSVNNRWIMLAVWKCLVRAWNLYTLSLHLGGNYETSLARQLCCCCSSVVLFYSRNNSLVLGSFDNCTTQIRRYSDVPIGHKETVVGSTHNLTTENSKLDTSILRCLGHCITSDTLENLQVGLPTLWILVKDFIFSQAIPSSNNMFQQLLALVQHVLMRAKDATYVHNVRKTFLKLITDDFNKSSSECLSAAAAACGPCSTFLRKMTEIDAHGSHRCSVNSLSCSVILLKGKLLWTLLWGPAGLDHMPWSGPANNPRDAPITRKGEMRKPTTTWLSTVRDYLESMEATSEFHCISLSVSMHFLWSVHDAFASLESIEDVRIALTVIAMTLKQLPSEDIALAAVIVLMSLSSRMCMSNPENWMVKEIDLVILGHVQRANQTGNRHRQIFSRCNGEINELVKQAIQSLQSSSPSLNFSRSIDIFSHRVKLLTQMCMLQFYFGDIRAPCFWSITKHHLLKFVNSIEETFLDVSLGSYIEKKIQEHVKEPIEQLVLSNRLAHGVYRLPERLANSKRLIVYQIAGKNEVRSSLLFAISHQVHKRNELCRLVNVKRLKRRKSYPSLNSLSDSCDMEGRKTKTSDNVKNGKVHIPVTSIELSQQDTAFDLATGAIDLELGAEESVDSASSVDASGIQLYDEHPSLLVNHLFTGKYVSIARKAEMTMDFTRNPSFKSISIDVLYHYLFGAYMYDYGLMISVADVCWLCTAKPNRFVDRKELAGTIVGERGLFSSKEKESDLSLEFGHVCEIVKPFRTTLCMAELRGSYLVVRRLTEEEYDLARQYSWGRQHWNNTLQGSNSSLNSGFDHKFKHDFEDQLVDRCRRRLKSQILTEASEVTIPLTKISSIENRMYMLQPVGIELFYHRNFPGDFDSILLAFPFPHARDAFSNQIVKNYPALSERRLANREDFRKAIDAVMSKWRKGTLSNFDYLIWLNRLAGRSHHDLSQYPIFPWVIGDYESETIDLDDPFIYRDLRYPMGAQSNQRRQDAQMKYQMLEETYQAEYERRQAEYEGDSSKQCSSDFDPSGDLFTSGPPWHWGSHYLNAGFVTWYLQRMEPFLSYSIFLHDGKLDTADRQFKSVSNAFKSCSTSASDVKEVPPEFYYCPEFLTADKNVEFGKTQMGQWVQNVKLPPWADGSPEKFIKMNRAALESSYVRRRLHHWIDLIFGVKQRGPYHPDASPRYAKEAVESCNIFSHAMYPGTLSLSAPYLRLHKPKTCWTLLSLLDDFGQMPPLLFESKHPIFPPDCALVSTVASEMPSLLFGQARAVPRTDVGNDGSRTIIPFPCSAQHRRVLFTSMTILKERADTENLLKTSPFSPMSDKRGTLVSRLCIDDSQYGHASRIDKRRHSPPLEPGLPEDDNSFQLFFMSICGGHLQLNSNAECYVDEDLSRHSSTLHSDLLGIQVHEHAVSNFFCTGNAIASVVSSGLDERSRAVHGVTFLSVDCAGIIGKHCLTVASQNSLLPLYFDGNLPNVKKEREERLRDLPVVNDDKSFKQRALCRHKIIERMGAFRPWMLGCLAAGNFIISASDLPGEIIVSQVNTAVILQNMVCHQDHICCIASFSVFDRQNGEHAFSELMKETHSSNKALSQQLPHGTNFKLQTRETQSRSRAHSRSSSIFFDPNSEYGIKTKTRSSGRLRYGDVGEHRKRSSTDARSRNTSVSSAFPSMDEEDFSNTHEYYWRNWFHNEKRIVDSPTNKSIEIDSYYSAESTSASTPTSTNTEANFRSRPQEWGYEGCDVVATGSMDCLVKLWVSRRGCIQENPLFVFSDHRFPICCISLSEKYQLTVSIDTSSTVCIYSLSTGALKTSFHLHGRSMSQSLELPPRWSSNWVTVSSVGILVAYDEFERSLHSFNKFGKELVDAKTIETNVRCFLWSTDGHCILVGGENGYVYFYDPLSWFCRWKLGVTGSLIGSNQDFVNIFPFPAAVTSMQFVLDETILIVGLENGKVYSFGVHIH